MDPARVRTGRVALDATRNALQVQLAPDDATVPTWAPTNMAVTEAGVGVGIGYPHGGATLHVLGDVRIDGGVSANNLVLAPWPPITTRTLWICTAQQTQPGIYIYIYIYVYR